MCIRDRCKVELLVNAKTKRRRRAICESDVDESPHRDASRGPGRDRNRAALELRGDRPGQEYRPAAAASLGRQSDRAAGLQAGADADAGGAAGLLQSQFAVAQRLARLLQGPALSLIHIS